MTTKLDSQLRSCVAFHSLAARLTYCRFSFVKKKEDLTNSYLESPHITEEQDERYSYIACLSISHLALQLCVSYVLVKLKIPGDSISLEAKLII